MATKKNIKPKKLARPASWVPTNAEEAHRELRVLLAASPDALAALERAWGLAIKIAPSAVALAKYPEKPTSKSPLVELDDKRLAAELLGADVDVAVLTEVTTVISNMGLILTDKRPDKQRRSESERLTYLTSLLAPYLYACCEVVLGVVNIKSRWWALSDLAFNPGATAPTSDAEWELITLTWRKHYMVGGAEGSKDKQGNFKPHRNNITVDGVRRRLHAALRAVGVKGAKA